MNGQCFNWTKSQNDKQNMFYGVWQSYFIQIQRLDSLTLEFSSQPEMPQKVLDEEFLGSYLRYPSVNVEKLYSQWTKADSKYFAKAGTYLPGVRCLRQDPWECLICFILSSNNNIKRIQSLVIKLRETFGETIPGTKEHAFPTIEKLLQASEQQLRDLGLGYRAKFIVESVKIIQQKGGHKWLFGLRAEKDSSEVVKELTQLLGVGRKVADCVRLFSLDNDSAIPVDTHVF